MCEGRRGRTTNVESGYGFSPLEKSPHTKITLVKRAEQPPKEKCG